MRVGEPEDIERLVERQREYPNARGDVVLPPSDAPHAGEQVPANWPALIYRYENGGCSFLAMAFRDLYGWQPLNLGGEHVIAADPDGEHGWDIRGRSPLDDLTQRWGEIEPWEPWAKQAFGLSSDPAGDEHRVAARAVVAAHLSHSGS